MVKKLSVEFKELLTAKALGHFMDNIVCRAFSLGPNLPIVKMIQIENAKTTQNGSQLEVTTSFISSPFDWFPADKLDLLLCPFDVLIEFV